jgi:hypothetical protein
MRLIARALLCAGMLLAAAGCDPATDNKYFYEGAGKDLYSVEGANQTALLNEYINYICGQAGNPGGTCSADTLVNAGMNDIDQRCDAYLTWLDGQRRNKEPVLAELSALNTATHAIMAVTGVGPKALDIVTAAFGLATATYTNWNSRLLLAVNQSTVQTIVYSRQQQYRAAINNFVVPDRPYAIYLLRNYLRICMPITIETDINTSTTLVQRGAPTMAERMPVVQVIRPSVIRNVNAPLRRYTPPPPKPGRVSIGRYEARMQQKEMDLILDTLGCKGSDLGPAGSPARKALSKFLTDNSEHASDHVTDGVSITIRELRLKGKRGTCGG